MDQLSSIAKQTIAKDIELIVCDDRSTDQTVAILKRFANAVSFPVYFIENDRQLGVLQNFLKAFELCRAPFIAYCDQDDVWQPDKLERCLNILQREPSIALVSHSSIITDENLHPTGFVVPRRISGFRKTEPHFPLSYWGFGHQMVFCARLVPLIRYFSGLDVKALVGYYKNLDRLIPLCAGLQGGIAFISKPLTYFRRHSNSVSPAGKGLTHPQSVKPFWKKKEEGLKILYSSLLTHQQIFEQEKNGLVVFIQEDVFCAYKRYIDILRLRLLSRLEIYTSRRPSDRMRSILNAYASGAYRNESDGGFGSKELVADAYGVAAFIWRVCFDKQSASDS